MKRLIVKIIFLAIGLFLGLWFYFSSPKTDEEKIVNVYCFYGMIPASVLSQFEKETGIKVQFDIYDNNEILEAKLLASNSGYDVVLPTSPPYVSRQIAVGIYQPLNKKWLPNLKDLDPVIIKEMELVDSGTVYAVPYYWGTVGIAYDDDKLKKLLPHADLESNDLLFNPENLKRLASYGVSFFEEAIDVFPEILHYLGKDPNSIQDNDLIQAYEHLLKLRPYILRFTSSRFINDLIMENVCITQAWSGEAQQAIDEAKELGRCIKYVIPSEGAGLWVDSFMIPAGAIHPKNAHIFINFLLKPEISAQIINETCIATTVKSALVYVKKDIRNNKAIYPSEKTMSKLKLYQLPVNKQTTSYERERNRLWSKIRYSLTKTH